MSTDRLAEVQQVYQQGNKVRARQLLSQILISDPRSEQAWLLMARLADTQQQVIECLQWALKVNPHNASTRLALKSLTRQPLAQAQRVALTVQASPAVAVPVSAPQPISSPETEILTRPSTMPSWAKAAPTEKKEERGARAPHHKINWSLWIGSLIVLLVVLIAVLGPQLAPQDPMEEHNILKVNGQWVVPPFHAFKIPGYPLGSDEFGRDLLSRILYAVRPTLTMVGIVAIVRLFLGTLIGLGAGWFNNRFGRFLDMLIGAALSVPILMVALGAIAMLGAEIGILAFIVGLSINGWGETARFVREQTRLIKGQVYIESAHALGASAFQMLVNHVLRQIMPMVWMLLAFEVSGTLMVTAGLGFLGYFIGGDVWVEVNDFVSRRISGAPELGQMLATSWVSLLEPWPLVLTGSVIFLTVLGFNLLGDGLRFRLNPEYINRNSPIVLLSHRIGLWFEQSVSYPISGWLKANRLRPAFVVITVIALAGSAYLINTRFAGNASQAKLTVPGGQIWASERIDPYGTGILDSTFQTEPQELWKINNTAGFSGSPVISADGTVYVASLNSSLLAINPDGTVRWLTPLPQVPLGPLALSPQGNIYVTDVEGGISAISPEGNMQWSYTPDTFGKPVHGAIVAPDGTIYYLLEDPRGDKLFAISADGIDKWSVQTGTRQAGSPLRLSPDAKEIFTRNVAINVADGSIIDLKLPTQGSAGRSGRDQLFVGSDGKTYLLVGHVVIQWQQTLQGFRIIQKAEWDYYSLNFYQANAFPVDAGILPDGNIWLLYSGDFGGSSVVWLNPTGKFQGISRAPLYDSTRVVASDHTGTVTLCGVGFTDVGGETTMCAAYRPENDSQNTNEYVNKPIWRYVLGVESGAIVGTAMAPGRLYVITSDGNLTALGEPSTATPSP